MQETHAKEETLIPSCQLIRPIIITIFMNFEKLMDFWKVKTMHAILIL